MSDFNNGTNDESRKDDISHDEGGGAGTETCNDDAFRNEGNASKDEPGHDGRRCGGASGASSTRHHSRGSIFDSFFNDDYDEEPNDDIDIEMERFFRDLNAIKVRLSHAIEALFGVLMSRSMGCANFTAVTIALLVCTRVIGAVFVDADALCELNALAFAVSLAVQGALSNIAGGIQVLSAHPYKIGDFVEIGDVSVTVTCKKCGAMAVIPADSLSRAQDFLGAESLELS